jgi:hypothetical protein
MSLLAQVERVAGRYSVRVENLWTGGMGSGFSEMRFRALNP